MALPAIFKKESPIGNLIKAQRAKAPTKKPTSILGARQKVERAEKKAIKDKEDAIKKQDKEDMKGITEAVRTLVNEEKKAAKKLRETKKINKAVVAAIKKERNKKD